MILLPNGCIVMISLKNCFVRGGENGHMYEVSF